MGGRNKCCDDAPWRCAKPHLEVRVGPRSKLPDSAFPATNAFTVIPMSIAGWLQIVFILALVVAAAVPLGAYINRVLAGEATFLSPVLGPVERGFYGLAGVDSRKEQGWLAYTMAMLVFRSGSGVRLWSFRLNWPRRMVFSAVSTSVWRSSIRGRPMA